MSDTASFEVPATLPFTEAPTTAALEVDATCDHCGGTFTPRARSGGKPQRFCNADCRAAFHAQRGQRAPTCEADFEPVATEARRLGEVFKAELAAAGGDAALVLADTLNRIEAARAQEQQTEDDFSWESGDDSVMLKEQYATAAYFNKAGELIIRQRRWPDEDQFIFIAPQSVAEFLDKLTDACGVPSVP